MSDHTPTDPLREMIEREERNKFLRKMEKKNRWIPLGVLLIVLLGLLIVINAIFAPIPSQWLLKWIENWWNR